MSECDNREVDYARPSMQHAGHTSVICALYRTTCTGWVCLWTEL